VKFLAKSALLLSVAGLGVAGALHLAQTSAPVPIPPALPVPVVTASVEEHDVPIILQGLGTVQALNTATIRTQVIGLLQSVDFIEGQTVHRGDVLAQIDPRPAQARLDQANAQLTRDQAQLGNLQVNLGRNVPLLRKGFATDQQVTDQQAQVSELQSALKSDQGSIDDATAQLSYTTLTAPFDGVTGVRTLDVGNIIHPTDANGLVVVTQVQPISILFTLPSAAIGQVQDALAKGKLAAVAYDQAGVTALDTGQLLLINNQADPASGTVQLKALFPNVNRRLWPGTFVNVNLTTSVVRNGLSVSTDAVQQGIEGEFVFVVGAGQKVAMRPVQVAQRERGVVLVSSGLKPGEIVVVQGQYRLVDGTVVQPSAPDQVADTSAATSGLLP